MGARSTSAPETLNAPPSGLTSPPGSPPASRRQATSTSSFGVGRREGHDASGFYARFPSPVVSDDDTVVRPSAVDRLWVGDARAMDHVGQVADGSVALVVTSPPYFAGKEYEEALGVGHVPADYVEYLTMLHDVLARCVAKLEPGGRLAINVANLGRKPYRSLSADIVGILQDLGLLLRGEIVWRKSLAAGGSCAWGTYQRPGNPVLRDVTERVVLASKGRFDRARTPEQRRSEGLPHEGSMTMDEFVDATTDVWDLPAESATRVGHPAPFPVELPRRLIELYTYRGDLVLDPFLGSGSTAVAALRTGRHYLGFDTDADYVALAERRLEAERRELAERDHRRPQVTVGIGRTPAASPDMPEDELMASGQKARDVTELALRRAGFVDIERGAAFGDLGTAADFRARDSAGQTWLFLLAGAFSTTRPGLKRAEVLWRMLGTAAVLSAARNENPGRDDLGPVVLVTTDLPPARSAGAKALGAAAGPSGCIHGVIELGNPTGAAQLTTWAADSSAR